MSRTGANDVSPKVVAFAGGLLGSAASILLFVLFVLGGDAAAEWASAASGLAGGVAGGIVAFLIARVTVEKSIEPVWEQVELQTIEPLRKLRDEAADTVNSMQILSKTVDRIGDNCEFIADLLDAERGTVEDRNYLYNTLEFREAANAINGDCQAFLTAVNAIVASKHARIALRRSMHDVVGAARKLEANAALLYEARADPKGNGPQFIENTAASIRRDRSILMNKFDIALESEAKQLETIKKRLEPVEDRLFKV